MPGHNHPQGISVFENMSLPIASTGELPPDFGKSQGGNAWRYAAMVDKGFIKPLKEGQRGWKSEDELRGILCFVSSFEYFDLGFILFGGFSISDAIPTDITHRCARML